MLSYAQLYYSPMKISMNKEQLQWLVIALVAVGLIGLGLMTLNQNSQLSQMARSLSAVASNVQELAQARNSPALQPTTMTEPTPTPQIPTNSPQDKAWRSVVSELSPCDAKKEAGATMPAQPDFEVFGLKDLLNGGFHVAQACYDTASHRVALILAKQSLTRPTPNSQPTCVDSCDEVEYRTFDTISGDWYSVGTVEHLGIYAEAYNQGCLIDKIIPGSRPRLDTILFYCGSGESGGMTTWYQYDLGVDSPKLVTVQTMTNLDPEKFDVKRPELLKLFKYQSNAAMR